MSPFDQPVFSQRLFFPRRDQSPPPPGARDLMVAVSGATLHLRLHESPGAVACVLFFHGNGEVVSDYDDLAPRFAQIGADLAVVDYRGYGRSTGSPSLRLCLEDARPVASAVLAARTGRRLPLIVHGHSLGSACAAELARSSADLLAGVIFESGFTDLRSFAERRGVDTGPLSEADLETFCPLRKLQASARPLLVLHGAQDTLIPPADAQAAYEHGGGVRRLALLAGAGHNDILAHPACWDEIAAFVGRVIADGSAPR